MQAGGTARQKMEEGISVHAAVLAATAEAPVLLLAKAAEDGVRDKLQTTAGACVSEGRRRRPARQNLPSGHAEDQRDFSRRSVRRRGPEQPRRGKVAERRAYALMVAARCGAAAGPVLPEDESDIF